MRRAVPSILVALLWLGASREARGGGAASREGRSRIAAEEVLVVWNHRTKIQHTFVSARVRSRSEGAYLAAFPAVVTPAGAIAGVPFNLAELTPSARLTPEASTGVTVASPTELAGACKNLGFACDKAVAGWPDGERFVLVVPFPAAPDGGIVRTPWGHVQHDTPHPVLPFSDPPGEGPTDTSPTAVDDDHPPRIDLWAEIGVESKTGAWERGLDVAVNAVGTPLAACYAKVLAKLPRLSGDVHVQIRLPAEGKLTTESSRASSRSLEPVMRCLSEELAKADLPRLPGRTAPLEVHATLRPPVALPRAFRAVVLTSQDAEARLGPPESEKVLPDTKLVASFEASPAALRRAFEGEARAALGLDLGERWRVLVLESTAEKHGAEREVSFRTLDFPALAPGEAPLPIVAAGDRPVVRSWAKPKWYRRRAPQRLALAFALALGVGLTLLVDRRYLA